MPGLLPGPITKHKNTAKVLIGISPQGVVTYMSEAWGGRVSDKHLTENCDILQNLLPGNIVLADRGFDIADSVGMMQARLYIHTRIHKGGVSVISIRC